MLLIDLMVCVFRNDTPQSTKEATKRHMRCHLCGNLGAYPNLVNPISSYSGLSQIFIMAPWLSNPFMVEASKTGMAGRLLLPTMGASG
jgi:hypothetical protein